jgi:hypothetical protein
MSLEVLQESLIASLQEQFEEFKADIAQGGNDDLYSECAQILTSQKAISEATTYSQALLLMQNHGWALPAALTTLFRALEPDITRETINKLTYHWDT